MSLNDVIFGKDKTEKIVSIWVDGDTCTLFKDIEGKIETEVRENRFWITSRYPFDNSKRLSGDHAYYRYITEYYEREEFENDRKFQRKKDIWSIYDAQESHLVRNGVTYYKNMKLEDVSVLSFDIEAVGLARNQDSKVLIISNTFRKDGKITKKLFKYDDYNSCGDMIADWCEWVRSVDPSIICGHNIFGYDLPYLEHCVRLEYQDGLRLGRDGTEIKFNIYESQKRKDGSQEYTYINAKIVGREIIDTMFRAFDYDKTRKEGAYTSYALKQIIKEEGLEKDGRQFYDASKIKDNYTNPEEWAKIIEYAKDDADDSLKLFDLMMPSAFYFCQHVPKTLQQIVNSATGSQLNAFMVRAYIQNNEGLPKADESTYVKGGISFNVPGIYKNLLKVDLKSAYPSQILRFKLYDSQKDPHGYFYEMVKYFTYQRFELKDQHKKTGYKHFFDREQSSKIFINSAYGLCNTPGLLFNSPKVAAIITGETRNVIDMALTWASSQGASHWISLFRSRTGQEDAQL